MRIALPLLAALLSPAALADEGRSFAGVDIDAHTDAPLQIAIEVQLDAPPEEVFQLTAVDIPLWFTAIPSVTWDNSHSEVPGAIAAGSERRCAFGDDALFEDIAHWEDGRVVAYAVDVERSTAAPPFKDHLGVMRVEPDGQGGSVLTWHQYYRRQLHPMAPMVNAYLRNTMLDALDELVLVAGGGAVVSVD